MVSSHLVRGLGTCSNQDEDFCDWNHIIPKFTIHTSTIRKSRKKLCPASCIVWQ